MIYVTKQQRANLLQARDVMWPSVPPKNVYPSLRFWRKENDKDTPCQSEPTCGTVACFGGWCAFWPEFQKQGIEPNEVGAPTITIGGMFKSPSTALFGVSGLFTVRGHFYSNDGAPVDGLIISAFKELNGRVPTDHELVTQRLNWVLRNTRVQE